MQRFVTNIALAAALVAAPGQGLAKGSISGRVSDEDTGRSIIGASVYLVDTNHGSHTDTEGTYELSEVPPGVHTLRATMVGYEERDLEVTVRDRELSRIEMSLKLAPIRVDEIVVSATRMERRTAEVSASVTVVEDAIAETRMFNIKEALMGTPGVLIDTKNQGYDSRLIIRGAGLKARYGVRDIMVLLDGVPITDPDGFTRLDFVDTQLIKRVEVVKGPNSTLWGANAAGGLVNIVSKSPFERQGGSTKVGGGDFSTGSLHLAYAGSLGPRLHYAVSGSRRQSDNTWRRWNEFWTNQTALQTSWISPAGWTLENTLSYTKASMQLPGKMSAEQYARYEDTGDALETCDPWYYSGRYSEIYFFSSRLRRKIGDWELVPMVYANHWTHHHPVTGRINDADTYTYGTDVQVNRAHSLAGGQGTLSVGVTIRADDQETDYFEYADYTASASGRILQVNSDVRGEHLERQDREVLLSGVYAQEALRLTDRWIVDAGIRLDRVGIDISGTAEGEYSWGMGTYLQCPDASAGCGPYRIEKTYTDISPRLGVNYRLLESLHVYGNVSTGIQTPTEGEIGDNPDLKLVKIRNYELGAKVRQRQWTGDAAIYFSPVENEVMQVVTEGGESEYVNAGRTEKKGFEVAGSYRPVPEVTLGATYAYSHYRFDEFAEPVRSGRTQTSVDRSGNQLPYIPKHQSSFTASYRHSSGVKAGVQLHNWGEYYRDNANSEKYGGYAFLTNARVGYENDRLDVGLNVDNATDKRYAVEVEKDTGGVSRYTPAIPRHFMTRLTVKF